MDSTHDSAPAAFLSYVRFEDEHNNGRITEFRKYLSSEVRTQTGEAFPIFQDREDIQWGEQWEDRVKQSINQVTLLIPVITPSFFRSDPCRSELTLFLERERELKRNDLILPLYYVDTPLINDPSKRTNDELAQAIASRQYADWRKLRFKSYSSPEVGEELEKLAIQIRKAIERTVSSRELELLQAEQRDEATALKPLVEEKGLVEGQEAAQQSASILAQIAETMSTSTEAVNKLVERISGGPQDRNLASLMAASINSGSLKIEGLVSKLDENIDTINAFCSGYVLELDPAIDDDRVQLKYFRDQFLALSNGLEIGLERVRSVRHSGSKLRISSEVIRANKRRAKALNAIIASMQNFYEFCVAAIKEIDSKLDPSTK